MQSGLLYRQQPQSNHHKQQPQGNARPVSTWFLLTERRRFASGVAFFRIRRNTAIRKVPPRNTAPPMSAGRAPCNVAAADCCTLCCGAIWEAHGSMVKGHADMNVPTHACSCIELTLASSSLLLCLSSTLRAQLSCSAYNCRQHTISRRPA